MEYLTIHRKKKKKENERFLTAIQICLILSTQIEVKKCTNISEFEERLAYIMK